MSDSIKIKSSFPLAQRQTEQTLQKQKEKIRGAAELYEKQFLREMVKAMRKTVSHSGLTQPSMAEKIFREKLDNQYVESWGDKGGIGLADLIYQQLNDRFFGNHLNLQRPQGPLPVKPGTEMPAVGPADEAGGSSFRFKVKEQSQVTSPWAGRVSAFENQGEFSLVRISHTNGLQSLLSFRGQPAGLNIGKELAAGDVIGRVLPTEGSQVVWKVTNSA